MLRCVGVGRARVAVLTAMVGIAASAALTSPAEARRHHRAKSHAARGGGYAPPFSAIVVDANTGRTMYAVDETAPRHPASITKVMTLYLLFEQLERGTLSLDSDLRASSRSAAQAPSKIGIRPGETISVEDAIKAIVTKSANDVACTIAENIAGSEEEFAERMTRKARQLGMTGTVYRNASGLPNPEQITTARDLTILGRAIQEKFPRYYKYFQTRSFEWAGRNIGNHNRLLGRIEGVDGIKTGFTNASGFNLLTSARIDGRHVVGVVLGGRSGASRDNIMANLIRTNLARASTAGSSSVFAEADERPTPPARQRASAEDIDTTASMAIEPKPARSAGRPLDLTAMRPAVASATGGSSTMTPSSQRSVPGVALAYASASPAEVLPLPPPTSQKIEARLPPSPIPVARIEPPVRETKSERAPEIVRPAKVSPWVIQLGAAEGEGEARAILDEAKSKSGRLLSKAAPFTEKVVRSGSTLYRARFSGFSEADTAQEACRTLKRSGFACFATRS